MKKLIYLMVILLLLTPLSACSVSDIDEMELKALPFADDKCDCLAGSVMTIEKDFGDWYLEEFGEEHKYNRSSEYEFSDDDSLDVGNVQYSEGNKLYLEKAKEIAGRYIDTNYFTIEEASDDTLPYRNVYYKFTQKTGEEYNENCFYIYFSADGEFIKLKNDASKGYDKLENRGKQYKKKTLEKLNSDNAKELAKQAVLEAYEGYYVSKIDAEPEKLYIMPDGRIMRTYNVSVTVGKVADKKYGSGKYYVWKGGHDMLVSVFLD